VHIAVNVSNLTIQDSGWLTLLTELMMATPEVAKRLTVEITETAVHGDLKHAARFCAEVQALDCLIALDDFGSGYTSFRQLKTLSIDYVKIDGAFVRDLTDNADSRLFVKILLDFTKGFGLKSVAEFVESGEVAKMLMDLGVDYLQGYYFGKPSNTRPWVKEA
jgi:EAL domain-containing protein (putative c-di-GMP-specific phosphodiesterase class I)